MNDRDETNAGAPANYRTPRRSSIKRNVLCLLLGAVVFAFTTAYADTYTLLQDALLLRQRGEYARSTELFTQALKDASVSPRDRGLIYYYRGTNFDSAGQPSNALADFDAALELIPQTGMVYIDRGLTLDHLRRFDEATKSVKQGLRLDPFNSSGWLVLGNIFQGHGDLTQAIDSYNRSIELKPDNLQALFNRGLANHLSGNFEKADADYSSVVKLRPDLTDGYLNRGALRLAQGQTLPAISDFDAAIRIAPSDPVSWINRANAYLTLPDFPAALSDFTAAIKTNPSGPAGYLGRGRAYLFQDNFDAAQKDFSAAHERDPSNPIPIIWLLITRAHAHELNTNSLADAAAQITSDRWPKPVLDLYLGAMDPERAYAAANIQLSGADASRVCEAKFYFADFKRHHTPTSNVQSLFEPIVTECRLNNLIFNAARAELGTLGP